MRIVDCVQYTPEWFLARKGFPTASCADKIITPTGKLSSQAFGYICELLADVSVPGPVVPIKFVSPSMVAGSLLEPQARAFYVFDRNTEVKEVGFCIHDSGRYGCSPDALVGDDGLLQIKCPEAKTHIAYLLKGEMPPDYLPQVHMELFVTGRNWLDFLSYRHGFDSFVIRVTPNDYTKKVGEALEAFWVDYSKAWKRIFPGKEIKLADGKPNANGYVNRETRLEHKRDCRIGLFCKPRLQSHPDFYEPSGTIIAVHASGEGGVVDPDGVLLIQRGDRTFLAAAGEWITA
jgi:hypothetical protein